VDDHIDAGDQLTQQIAAGGVLQVQGDALLAGVEVEVEAAALGVRNVIREGSATAGWVASVGRLGLDDGSAEGGEELAAVGAWDEGGQLQDAEVG